MTFGAFEANVDGPLWLEVIGALPTTLAEPLAASVKSSEPFNSAIKQPHRRDTEGYRTIERRRIAGRGLLNNRGVEQSGCTPI